MSPTQEMVRQVRRGARTVMQGDTGRLAQMRREAEESDYLREAWEEVGTELRVAAKMESKGNSST